MRASRTPAGSTLIEDLLQNEPNLDGTQLKPLEAYEKKLAKRMAGEKKRLREAMEEDGE